MDFVALRRALEPILVTPYLRTHLELAAICDRLGMGPPGADGSKRDRMRASLDAVDDVDLPRVAECYLSSEFNRYPVIRNQIQELLWADDNGPPIPKRYRHELAEALPPDGLFIHPRKFDELLDKLFLLDDGPLGVQWPGMPLVSSLRHEIQRHIHDNPGDYSTLILFEKLGAFECTHHRFRLLLEGLAGPDVRPDEESQRRFVALVNEVLLKCGTELRETGSEGGYPVFTIISLTIGSLGRPKNLIFASPVKPDLRFRDAINNDIEIVSNADKVLIYDRPIRGDGIRWADLQAWWAELRGIANDDEAKKTLYFRLRQSLPSSSPPQMMLFETFFTTFNRRIPDLPALLPEVWLHWDPKTVAERGADALPRFRMDFLMLLPGSARVVIEVDGMQHYASDDGRASSSRYAAMVSADRDLRLAGYEVFRFGASELNGDDGRARVGTFFHALFKRHGVF